MNHPLPFVWLDALHVRVRDGRRIVGRAVLIAVATRDDGVREVLGLHVAANEARSAWATFLYALVDRGLRQPRLVVSDAHPGLRCAIREVLGGATWQRCVVHFVRELRARLPQADRAAVVAALRDAFSYVELTQARAALRRTLALLVPAHARLAARLRRREPELLAYLRFPGDGRRRSSTNWLERLNQEIRRRVRVVGTFPDDASARRLVGRRLASRHASWQARRSM